MSREEQHVEGLSQAMAPQSQQAEKINSQTGLMALMCNLPSNSFAIG